MFNRVSARFDNGDIGDMMVALPLFGWCALAALGMSLIFLLIITSCTWLMTWVLMLGLSFAFIATGVLIIYGYAYPGSFNDGWNPLRVKYL